MKRKTVTGILILLMAIASIGATPAGNQADRYQTNPNNSCIRCTSGGGGEIDEPIFVSSNQKPE